MNQTMTNNLTDRDIAMNMIKDSKHNLSAMSMALMETTDHKLREMLTNHFLASVNEHYALSDLVIKKDWYLAYQTPQEQLQNHFMMATSGQSR